MSHREPCDTCGATRACVHYPTPVDSFQARVRLAATCLRTSQGLDSRAFDNCFEMYDGDAVVASLEHLAQTDAALRAGIAKVWDSDLSKRNWLRTVDRMKHIPFAKLPTAARKIRASREAQSLAVAASQPAFNLI